MADLTSDDGGLRELALFAGAGGGILGGHLLGWRTVCAVEIEPYPASVLLARQNDGILPPFPVWDDVCTFDGRPWRGLVDVVSGGFPCQDISAAGKGAGITGKRSGLWSEMARIIGEVRPQFVFVENSPALITRGLGAVLGDLAALGYDCRWTVLGAADVGAPHQRDRIWIMGSNTDLQRRRKAREFQSRKIMGSGRVREDLANSEHQRSRRREQFEKSGEGSRYVADSDGLYGQRQLCCLSDSQGWKEHGGRQAGSCCDGAGWWESEPDVGRVVNGMAARVVRLKAIGNGQVPAVAAAAWRLLMDSFRTNSAQIPHNTT